MNELNELNDLIDFSEAIKETPGKTNSTKKSAKKRKRPEPQIEDDEEEDILDRFTDPEKKRKKKEKKEETEKQRRENLMAAGKLKAEDCFNVPLAAEEISLYKIATVEPIAPLAYLEKCVNKETISDIGYVRMSDADGLYCVLDFIQAAIHCMEWLDSQVKRMGWKMNMTGYNPISVSHSTEEVLSATWECYKMAAKQMILLLKHLQ